MAKKAVSVVLIGIGGYGNIYLKKLLDDPQNTVIAGVVEINPYSCEDYGRLIEKNIPIFAAIEDFYHSSHADLAIISTPIHLHQSQACYALQQGSHVLCEKPASASSLEIEKMIKARDQSGKFLAIGFNWSFHPSVQALKQDILTETFGKPIRFKSLVLWPRTKDYYHRSAWAGKKYSKAGGIILDSVANNATSHFLHHMFYLLGHSLEESCRIDHITAEVYRANPIESFDTCAVRSLTKENVEVLFYASHAVKEQSGPHFVLEFEKAKIYYSAEAASRKVIAVFNDGSHKVYGDPEQHHLIKLQQCIEAAAANDASITCGPEAAYAHTTCIESIHKALPKIPFFPTELIKHDSETKLHYAKGLDDLLRDCYNTWSLPHEKGISWSRYGTAVSANS